jgi:hypothetical protein
LTPADDCVNFTGTAHRAPGPRTGAATQDCALRCLTGDAFNALCQPKWRTDQESGNDYHQRLLPGRQPAPADAPGARRWRRREF